MVTVQATPLQLVYCIPQHGGSERTTSSTAFQTTPLFRKEFRFCNESEQKKEESNLHTLYMRENYVTLKRSATTR
jgi:hypothetical protein